MLTTVYNGSSVSRFVDGELGSASLITSGGNTSGPTALVLFRDGPDGSYAVSEGSLCDFRVYKTGLTNDDVKELYRTSANIDNLAGVHSFEFIEDDNSSVGENGIFESKVYDEMVELSDGSLWLPICYHYIKGGANLFKTTDDFTYPVFDSPDVWANFPIIDTVSRPESGYYEFLVKQQINMNGPWTTYRFKQTVNPLTATYSTAGPSSGNVTWITGGSSSYGGMYKLNSPTATSSNYMCFSNGSNGNWFGCGAKQAYNGGIPSICNTVPKGVQVVYIRVSSTMAQKYEMGLTNSRELIEK
ncbi:MAG: hypothetical protein IJH65_04260 [Methanobrevibacter sp.]|nr:hypothetical protein [Methanobrevibacter sp.]